MNIPIIAVIGRTIPEAQRYGASLLKAPFVAFAEHQHDRLSGYSVENFVAVPTIGDLPPAMIRVLAERLHDTDQQRLHYS